jgi:protein arginine kinase activator
MNCQTCQKNPATVHVTEVADDAPEGAPQPRYEERHLCEVCAQTMDLPHMPALKKTVTDIWKLLQISAQQTRRRSELTCQGCSLTLDDFRKKGRLGCERCYETFGPHLGELLERVHGARKHVGRLPGTSERDLERLQHLDTLRRELDAAIREEAYESAARLRDELKALEEQEQQQQQSGPKG